MAAEAVPVNPERPEPPSTVSADVQTTAAPAAAAVCRAESCDGDEPQLDAAKLHAYQVALELHAQCSVLVSLLHRVVRDQLERASLSVIPNTAEAAGRRSRRDKARYYAIARGSCTEVAALLDVLERRRLGSPAAIVTARRLAIRVVQMLTRVHQKLSA